MRDVSADEQEQLPSSLTMTSLLSAVTATMRVLQPDASLAAQARGKANTLKEPDEVQGDNEGLYNAQG